jgi:hypothetical protein
MAESRRNPDVAHQYQAIEQDVKSRLVGMLREAAARGEIAAGVDFEAAATVLMVLADGMSWRRAVDPAFDAETVLPMVLHMVHCVLTQPQEVDHRDNVK